MANNNDHYVGVFKIVSSSTKGDKKFNAQKTIFENFTIKEKGFQVAVDEDKDGEALARVDRLKVGQTMSVKEVLEANVRSVNGNTVFSNSGKVKLIKKITEET